MRFPTLQYKIVVYCKVPQHHIVTESSVDIVRFRVRFQANYRLLSQSLVGGRLAGYREVLGVCCLADEETMSFLASIDLWRRL